MEMTTHDIHLQGWGCLFFLYIFNFTTRHLFFYESGNKHMQTTNNE